MSLPTSFEGAYLDTYNLEIDLKPTLRISRHNIPPFIPLNSLAEQSNMQTDIKAFLETLGQHLNAFVGRKQQLKLVKVPNLAFFNCEYSVENRILTLSSCSFKGTPQVCCSDGEQCSMFNIGIDVHCATRRGCDSLHAGIHRPHEMPSHTSLL